MTIRELAPNPTPGRINKDFEFKSLNYQNNSVNNNEESGKVNQDNRDQNQDFEEVLKARFWSHINALAGELDSSS